jgi:tetratricopeptide (TPR) repeat protein
MRVLTGSLLLCVIASVNSFQCQSAAAAALSDIPGYPDSIFGFDPREIALLPKYCPYTKVYRDNVGGPNPQPDVDHWRQVMGPSFEHMHHYCNGLMDTNRALLLVRDQGARWFYLDAAIKEFNYVIRYADHEFVMLPEIWTKKGENLLRLGRTALGLQALNTAIKLKSDYWPPYVALSDHYKKAGQPAEARQWLEKALVFAPDTKAVSGRLAVLKSGK